MQNICNNKHHVVYTVMDETAKFNSHLHMSWDVIVREKPHPLLVTGVSTLRPRFENIHFTAGDLGEIYISNFTIKSSNHLFSKTWLTNFEAKGYTLSLCCDHDRIQTLAMSFTSVSGYWNYTQLSLYSNCNSETPYSVDRILYWGPCEETLKTFWNQTKKQILPVPSWIIATVSGCNWVSALFECSGHIAYRSLARSTA
jgi:hypothetical protein